MNDFHMTLFIYVYIEEVILGLFERVGELKDEATSCLGLQDVRLPILLG